MIFKKIAKQLGTSKPESYRLFYIERITTYDITGSRIKINRPE